MVRFHAVEELAAPFSYSIALVRTSLQGPVLLDHLVNAPASFAIQTLGRFRVVHGVIAEAEQVDRTSELILYKVLLVPHLARAQYRRRCRNFVLRSIKEIVTAVLRNAPPGKDFGDGGLEELDTPVPPVDTIDFTTYTEPRARFRWSVTDPSRIEDKALRHYAVQYNESDFDFISRLLEEEGISYYFEHGSDQVVLALTDRPGQPPAHAEDAALPFKGTISGDTGAEEFIRTFSHGRRLRSHKVTMRDFSFPRSNIVLQGTAIDPSPDAADFQHFEYPARDESVLVSPCVHPSAVRLQRFEVERFQGSGSGTVRRMEPGRVFVLHDPVGIHAEKEYLIVRVEACGVLREFPGTALDHEPFGLGSGPVALGGYRNEFTVLTTEALQFRPPQRTPRPRIDGVESAIVTAEEFAEPRPEINVDEIARVRVRFPWDEKPDDGTPTSFWIRVSQHWAGGGFGAVYIPRVGDEVLVAYLQGDPERPIIVGRVYNGQRVPPFDTSAHPTRSTLKSRSSPKAEGSNELRFEDLAGKEEIFLHAQRSLNEVVGAGHSTFVGGDQRNNVAHNQTTNIDGNRETVVVGTDRLTVVGDRHEKTANCYNSSGQYSILASSIYFGNDALGGIACDMVEAQCANFQVRAKKVVFEADESFEIKVGKDTTLSMFPNTIILRSGPHGMISLLGGRAIISVDTRVSVTSDGSIAENAKTIELTGGASIDATAPIINLNK